MERISLVAGAGRAAVRLGLLADTHDDLCDWPSCAARIADAFADLDAILHCGDLCTLAALDGLERLGPVYAVRSPADPPADPPRLVDGPRLFEAAGLRIGLVNALPDGPSRTAVREALGTPVDVLVFGGTHTSFLGAAEGTLLVNPGSPSLASERSAAILEIEDGVAACRMVSWPGSP
jgi:uncharacterized protein